MSIIERMVELLGSVPSARPNPSAADERGRTREQNLIERAAGTIGHHPDLSVVAAPAVGPRFEGRPASPASSPARIFRIDRDRLRRQSMTTPDGERTPMAESFRRIKRQILANLAAPRTGAPPANLVLVTSALPKEGKTFCTINLSISLALEMDRTVLLVDGDVAKPSVPQALGLEAEKGLMDVLLDRRIDLAEVLWKTDLGKLALLPVGTGHRHATELLASDAMRGLLREMAERYHDRIIVFDSPPLLAVSEASVLASQMGQIVVVVEAGKTSEAELKDALGRIDSDKVTGLLLNKGEGSTLGYGYGYGVDG
jgi:protein-tyrosine kinase